MKWVRSRQMPPYALVVTLVSAIGVGVWTQSGRGGAQPAADHPSLRQVVEFELPGPPGKRFDYLTIDEDDNHLLSAHLGAGLLHVVDLRTNAVVKTVPDVPGIEGVAYIAEDKKIYTANWGENKIGVIDVARMAVVKRLPTEAKPDGIAYAAPSSRVPFLRGPRHTHGVRPRRASGDRPPADGQGRRRRDVRSRAPPHLCRLLEWCNLRISDGRSDPFPKAAGLPGGAEDSQPRGRPADPPPVRAGGTRQGPARIEDVCLRGRDQLGSS